MQLKRTLVRTALTASLCVPAVAVGQQDTTRMRDTTRMGMQDTTMMRRDSTNMRRTAQPPVRSEQRIRVQKGEAGGTLEGRGMSRAEQARQDSLDRENAMRQRQQDSIAAVERTRADSVARVEAARRDSVAAVERARADSVARVEAARRDSVARADSIAAAEEARRRELARYRFGNTGWYVGIGAGGSAPTGDFKDLGYNSGLNVNVPIGWHRQNNFLGVRLDFNYNRFSGKDFIGRTPAGSAVTLDNPNPSVFSGTLNLTAAFPLTLVRNVSLYGVGGAGIYHFRDFGGQSSLSGLLGNDVLELDESNTKKTRNKLGAQIGLGLDWTVGTSAVYLESRFVNVFTDRDDTVQFRDFFGSDRSNTLKWVPIVLGVKIR